jgi:putative transposase
MLHFRIQRGVRFIDRDAQQWSIDRILPSRRIILLNELGVQQSLTHREVMDKWSSQEWMIDSRSIESREDALYIVTNRDLSTYSESDQAQARFRLEVIEPLLTKRSLSNRSIEAHCQRYRDPCSNKPISLSTVRRWICRYRARGADVTSLVDRRRGRRITDKSEFLDLFEQIIHEKYLVQEKVLRSHIVATIQEQIRTLNESRAPEEQLKVPSEATLFRRLRDLDAAIVDRTKYGADYANNKHRVAIAIVKTTRILERVELDNAQLDIILIDPYTGIVLGRPWLTVAVDHYSKMVLGFHLSLEAPDAQTIQQCLVNSILPKQGLLLRYPDITGEWPAAGIWKSLVMDNGMEMHAADLKDLCLETGMHILFCPRKKPWFKAVVERVCREFNGVVHQLPGTTQSNPTKRADYKSEKEACLDIGTLEHILIQWIVSIHNTKPHRKNQMPRVERWKQSEEKFGIELPESPAALQLLVSGTTTRTLFHYGVEYDRLQYNSTALQDLKRRLLKHSDGPLETEVVKVRYHEDTVEYVDVLDPGTDEYIRVYARDREYTANLTRFMHCLIHRQLREKYGDAWKEPDRIQARKEIAELVNAARRHHERIRRAAAKNKPSYDIVTYREIAKHSTAHDQILIADQRVEASTPTQEVSILPDDQLIMLRPLPVPHLTTNNHLGASL